MAGDDPDRFEPLLAIRKVAQRTEAGQVAAAAAVAAERDRALAAAGRVVEVAQRRVQAAEARLAELTAAGTTAALVAVGVAHGRRCRAALGDAVVELEQAVGASGASAQALQVAQERLVAARSRRELLERYLERVRSGQRQLRERRED